MTTRESLRDLLETLDDDDVETLARFAAASGMSVRPREGATTSPNGFIKARDYPALASVWNNDDDAVFDEL